MNSPRNLIATSTPPPAPQEETPEGLGFSRRAAVRWFAPLELVRSGLRAGLATLFGSYVDKREVQAAVRPVSELPEFVYRRTGTEDLWIDFVADLGDGFDATYTVARLLAEPRLTVGGHQTERGRILLMGGDQVYPVATRDEYDHRLIGPYRAALPWLPEDQVPHLFAIPGNHDWYDGLTAFLRLFTQERWVGAWKTRQSRSYYAIELPDRFWLFGIDIQLEADIDDPQRRYFLEVAKKLQPGDRVILCTAEPSWLKLEKHGGRSYHNLAYFTERIIRARGAEPVLTLTGDLHHYARYEERPARSQLITAGGGGAYTLGTHHLPKTIEPPTAPWQAATSERLKFEQVAAFPDAAASWRLAAHIWRFPFLNWRFSALLGLFWLFVTWVLESASRQIGPGLLARLRTGAPWDLPRLAGDELATSPAALLLIVCFALGAVAYARSRGGWACAILGLGNAMAQTLTWLLLLWAFVRIDELLLNLHRGGLIRVLLFALELFVAQSFAAGLGFAAYLWLSARLFNRHHDDIFAALGFQSHKGFVRLRLEPGGRLTVYPVGVRSIVHDWRLDPAAGPGAPFFSSRRFGPQLAAPIEPPLLYDPEQRRWRPRS